MRYPTSVLIKSAKICNFLSSNNVIYFFTVHLSPNLFISIMKRLLLLPLVALLVASCSQDIQTNSPAFQGVKDSILFRGFNNSATINPNGSIAVQGATTTESVRILVSNFNQSTVTLGANALAGDNASYTDELGNVFSTNNGNASGEVSIQINGDNTVSGTFNFVALTENSSDTVTFSRGFIFEVPILGVLGDVGQPSVENFFTARINTVIYNPTVITSSASGGFIVVSGNTADRAMTITMPEDISPGSYDIAPGGLITAAYSTPSGVSSAITGTLTIVSNDTTERVVTGDFIFNTADGFIITDGQFTVQY